MDVVHSMANLYRCSPFEVLASNVEDFILTLNYLVEKGADDNGRSKTKVTGRDPFWDLL